MLNPLRLGNRFTAISVSEQQPSDRNSFRIRSVVSKRRSASVLVELLEIWFPLMVDFAYYME